MKLTLLFFVTSLYLHGAAWKTKPPTYLLGLLGNSNFLTQQQVDDLRELAACILANPSDHALLVRHKREMDFIGNTQKIVQQLIENLQSAANFAINAVKSFREAIVEQAQQFSEKIMSDVNNFRDRVNNAIKSFTDRFTNAGSAVQACVESFRKEADEIFTDTVEKSKICADERIDEIGNLIENLRLLSVNATNFATNAVNELRACRDTSSGIFSTGSCLGNVAVNTEIQGAIFMTQSGLSIARINLALTTLPASLEVCAGTKIVAAGINSAKIVMEVGTCSASSVYSSITGNGLS